MLKRKAHPDSPWSSMKRREKPINKFSSGGRTQRAGQQRVYQQLDAEADGCCFTCKRWGPTQHSHLFPQGMNQLLKAVAANIIAECADCHRLWGEKLPEYARRYPEALAAKVALMKRVHRQRWAFWMMKNDYLLKRK